jgi:hypothetical protein
VAPITVAADFAAMGGALVALPFIATDGGIAAGESTECFNPIAVVVRAEGFRGRKVMLSRSPLAALVTLPGAILAMPR